jgi:hypothetical protein
MESERQSLEPLQAIVDLVAGLSQYCVSRNWEALEQPA